MEEEGEKFCGIWVLGVKHGCATTGTSHAKLLELWLWSGMVVPLQARAVPAFWHFQAKKFSRFLESCPDNYLQNNLKQQKKQTK